MKKIKELDELQLLKRGNVFKHGLFTLGGLLLVNALLYSYGIEWASGKWSELTIILFTVVLCSIELICYDIYPLTEKRQKYLIYLFALLGLTALTAGIYDLVMENAAIIIDEKVTDSALSIIYGVMFIVMFLAYKIKKIHNFKHKNDE